MSLRTLSSIPSLWFIRSFGHGPPRAAVLVRPAAPARVRGQLEAGLFATTRELGERRGRQRCEPRRLRPARVELPCYIQPAEHDEHVRGRVRPNLEVSPAPETFFLSQRDHIVQMLCTD